MEYLETTISDFENMDMAPGDYIDNARGRGRRRRKAKRSARRTKRRSVKSARRAKRKGKISTEEFLKRKAAAKGTKRRSKAKAIGGKRGRRITKRATKIQKKRTASAAKRAQRRERLKSVTVLAPLQPLKPVMILALKKKGKTHSVKTPLSIIARDFYNTYVAPKSGFEEIPEMDNAVGAVGSAVVGAIIDYIKNLKKKKEEGKPLSKTEGQIVTGTEKVEAKIATKAKEEAAAEVGRNILFDKKTQLIIGGVILGIIAIVVVVIKK